MTHLSCCSPCSYFFDFQEKGRYVITREEANEYERRTDAARLQAAAHQAVAAASQYDPNYYYGYPPGQPWPQTNLGQKPKLGGVHISHRHYIYVHTLNARCRCSYFFIVSSMLVYFPLCFLLVCLINLKKNKKISCNF